jgi:uncharacterized protein
MTSQEEETLVLLTARGIVEDAVRRRPHRSSGDEVPLRGIEHSGVFVTLTKRGELRGCIGDLSDGAPFLDSLAHAAEGAALRDYRFTPIEAGELDELDVDVTILGPMEPLTGEAELRVGEHGLHIADATHRGILLPQVASERGWSAARFLRAVCEKAGLPDSAWTWPSVRLSRFTARVLRAPQHPHA